MHQVDVIGPEALFETGFSGISVSESAHLQNLLWQQLCGENQSCYRVWASRQEGLFQWNDALVASGWWQRAGPGPCQPAFDTSWVPLLHLGSRPAFLREGSGLFQCLHPG